MGIKLLDPLPESEHAGGCQARRVSTLPEWSNAHKNVEFVAVDEPGPEACSDCGVIIMALRVQCNCKICRAAMLGLILIPVACIDRSRR